MTSLAQYFTFASIPKGKKIIKYGETGHYFYIVVRGSVKILIPVEKKIELEDKNASRYVCKNMKHLVNRMKDRMM